ncbi:MAG: 30S ribosomal protein S9, partial [Promethearchaeota archaeon]
MSEKIKYVQSAGKRKSAIARATLAFPAKGQIKINNIPLNIYEPEIGRLRIKEVLEVVTH